MKNIDAHNAVLGRLASNVAKQLLAGESVVIVNAEKAIITGDPLGIKQKYAERRRRGSPQHGPFFPTRPEHIVRRTVRGMLPKTKHGRAALKKLRVCSGVPPALEGAEKFPARKIRTDFMTIAELAKSMGWNK